jgi:hypothetical protein
MMTRALSDGLAMVPLKSFLRSFQQRSTWGQEHPGDDATDDSSVERLVIDEVGEHGVGTAAGDGELNRPLPESFLQFIQVQV